VTTFNNKIVKIVCIKNNFLEENFGIKFFFSTTKCYMGVISAFQWLVGTEPFPAGDSAQREKSYISDSLFFPRVICRTPTKQSNRVSSLPAAAGSAAAAALHNGGGATKLLNGAAAAGTNGVSSSDEDMDTN
jgi:hypothetical protein